MPNKNRSSPFSHCVSWLRAALHYNEQKTTGVGMEADREEFGYDAQHNRFGEDKIKMRETVSPVIEHSGEGSTSLNFDLPKDGVGSIEDKCDDIKVEEAEGDAMTVNPDVEEDGNESSGEEDLETAPPSQSDNETPSFKLDVIENKVKNGLNLLDALKSRLSDDLAEWPQLGKWIDDLDALGKQDHDPTTVIGVVGGTGVGKSSLINALLDQDRLVPTSGTRACTAVVTEISQNDDLPSPFVGDIEFLSEEELECDLAACLQDLEYYDKKKSKEDDPSKIAFAKLKTIFPGKNLQSLRNSNAQDLIEEVKHLLNQPCHIEETTCAKFREKLKGYIGSSPSTTPGSLNAASKSGPALWPLIRVVKIYVRSRALASGAIIVDLPGVQDTNAARAAVADRYIKQCVSLWVTTPIKRAINDQVGRNLLGESFKRQLRMDAGFDTVTFVCTQSDDNSCSEMVEEIPSIQRELRELERERQNYETQRESISTGIRNIAVASDALYSSDSIKKEPVEGPSTDKDNPIARTKLSSTIQPRENASKRSLEDDLDAAQTVKRQRVEDQAPDVYVEWARGQKAAFEKTIQQMRESLQRIDSSIEVNSRRRVQACATNTCISARNKFVKKALRAQFLQELFDEGDEDQDEDAEEADEDHTQSAQNRQSATRSYKQIARELPVFCVSSKGYQQLHGRMAKDSLDINFESAEETHIPALQEHCIKVAMDRRCVVKLAFLNETRQLLTSLRLWAMRREVAVGSEEELFCQEEMLEKELTLFKDKFEGSQERMLRRLDNLFRNKLFDAFETAASYARDAAMPTVQLWSSGTADGGYHWGTWRAVCSRYGVFKNRSRSLNLNLELNEPMMKMIEKKWNIVFGKRVLWIMELYVKQAEKELNDFISRFRQQVCKSNCSEQALYIFSQQITHFTIATQKNVEDAKQNILHESKGINREFEDLIRTAMKDTYKLCAEQRGVGSSRRMKDIMHDGVDAKRIEMFANCTRAIQARLESLLHRTKASLSEKNMKIYHVLVQDATSCIGQKVDEQVASPERRRILRNEIFQIMMKQSNGLLEDIKNEDYHDVEPATAESSELHEEDDEEPDMDDESVSDAEMGDTSDEVPSEDDD